MGEIKREVYTPEEGYLRLAGEVVRGAFRSYVAALITGDKERIKRCEWWFRKGPFDALTLGEIDPEYIIEMARKEADRGHKKLARPVPEGDEIR